LWFLNRDKPKKLRDKVLMLNARDVYRKVTRKIYDFSPEQQKNLLAIVWLYRGQSDRFLGSTRADGQDGGSAGLRPPGIQRLAKRWPSSKKSSGSLQPMSLTFRRTSKRQQSSGRRQPTATRH